MKHHPVSFVSQLHSFLYSVCLLHLYLHSRLISNLSRVICLKISRPFFISFHQNTVKIFFHSLFNCPLSNPPATSSVRYLVWPKKTQEVPWGYSKNSKLQFHLNPKSVANFPQSIVWAFFLLLFYPKTYILKSLKLNLKIISKEKAIQLNKV